MLRSLLVLILALNGCALASRDVTATYNPETKAFQFHGLNSWMGGPVDAEVEMKSADGSTFKGRFGANANPESAVAARALDLQAIIGSLETVRALAAMYAASQGVPVPTAPATAGAGATGAPPAPGGPASAPASQPASAPAR